MTARRFNDRLLLDIIYIKDITGTSHMLLSQVDDGTTYHVADYLDDRSEKSVTDLLIKGWFRIFGPPDEMLLDAEGSFRSWGFELLAAQAGIRVRFVPADAHWQLGRAERHGQALKWVLRRLINQFSPTTREELELLITMAVASKNRLARRSGASPNQCVFGRDPKIPATLLSEPDAIEAKQVIQDSEKLRHVEQVRHQALKDYLDFESHSAMQC